MEEKADVVMSIDTRRFMVSPELTAPDQDGNQFIHDVHVYPVRIVQQDKSSNVCTVEIEDEAMASKLNGRIQVSEDKLHATTAEAKRAYQLALRRIRRPVEDGLEIDPNILRWGEKGVVRIMPTTEIQAKFVHCKSILDDVARLSEIISLERGWDYNQKLLAKFVVVELLSFRDNFRQFMNLIGQASREPDSEWKHDRRIVKEYETTLNKQPVWEEIRNKIGAHRDADVAIPDLVQYWDTITDVNIDALASSAAKALNAVYQLNYNLLEMFVFSGRLKGIDNVAGPSRMPFATKK